MFGWIKKKCSCVYGGLKKVASTVAQKVVDGAKWVGHQVSTAYKRFSGEAKAEEAERLYAELQKRVQAKEAEFAEFALDKERRINAELEKINKSRVELSERLFSRYESIASNFANLEVVGVKGDGVVKVKHRNIKVRARGELFKIDFRNHPVKANALAVITLGFLTRKRADQSLKAVQAEEMRLEDDFAKMDAEKERLEQMLRSLHQISLYLTKTAKTYERILNELDYSVMFLRSCRRVLNVNVSLRSRFDVEFLPEQQLLTLMCADKATRILHSIASKQYVKADGKRLVVDEKDLADWEAKKQEFTELRIAA